jgi:hypothetical protein
MYNVRFQFVCVPLARCYLLFLRPFDVLRVRINDYYVHLANDHPDSSPLINCEKRRNRKGLVNVAQHFRFPLALVTDTSDLCR